MISKKISIDLSLQDTLIHNLCIKNILTSCFSCRKEKKNGLKWCQISNGIKRNQNPDR